VHRLQPIKITTEYEKEPEVSDVIADFKFIKSGYENIFVK